MKVVSLNKTSKNKVSIKKPLIKNKTRKKSFQNNVLEEDNSTVLSFRKKFGKTIRSSSKTDNKDKQLPQKIENPYNSLLKPYMDYLGIVKYNAFPLSYYSGESKLYIIETDFLETYIIKIFPKNAYKFRASIEKHFITNAKNISKLTPNINVAHDPDKVLQQFLFTDRRPGGNKKWNDLNAEDKSNIVKEIGKVLFKIHTYSSKRTMKEEIYGTVSNPQHSWNEYLGKVIKERLFEMKQNDEKISEIIKFEKYCESKLISLKTHKIIPSLLHGSIGLNEKGVIRSFLFLGTKISGVLNADDSIYGDKIWDLVWIHDQMLSQNINLEKDFFGEYGKLRSEEKERLEFYKKILF